MWIDVETTKDLLNFSVVAETACEEFNRFLDRVVVIGTLTNPCLGFLINKRNY